MERVEEEMKIHFKGNLINKLKTFRNHESQNENEMSGKEMAQISVFGGWIRNELNRGGHKPGRVLLKGGLVVFSEKVESGSDDTFCGTQRLPSDTGNAH